VKSVRLSKETLARIKRCAEILNRTEHAITVQAVEKGLPELESEADAWEKFRAQQGQPPKPKARPKPKN
jgi:predicted transcriptional regulator